VHQPAFATQRFLVVEDEPLIAIALQHLLEQEGATVIQVHNVTRALQLVQTSPLSAGIIDIGLGDDNAGPICDALDRRRVPFIFFTGQSDAALHRWPFIPVVEKPAMPEVIVGAIKYAIAAGTRDIPSTTPDEADAKARSAD